MDAVKTMRDSREALVYNKAVIRAVP